MDRDGEYENKDRDGYAEYVDRDGDNEYLNEDNQEEGLIALIPRKMECITAKIKELEVLLKSLRRKWNEIT